jgi:hypothetical protein
VSRFRLEEEEEISVFLSFLVIWKMPLLHLCRVLQMTRNFILLQDISKGLVAMLSSYIPPPKPYDSESTELSVNRDIVHPFQAQSSFSTVKKSLP